MNGRMEADSFAHLQAPSKMRAQFGQLALLLRQADLAENRYNQSLWLWNGEALAPLETGGRVADFWWMDKDHILFTRPGEGEGGGKGRTRLHLLPLAPGEEPREALTLPGVAEMLYSLPGGRLLYLAADVEGALPHGAQEQDRGDYEVMERLPFWADGGGFLRRRRLWLWENGALRSLGPGGQDVEEMRLSQDGSQLFFLTSLPGGTLPYHQLYRLDTETLLYESLPLPSPLFSFIALCEAPPGRLLVFGNNMEDYGIYQNGNFYLLDLDSLCYQTLYSGGMHTCWSSVISDVMADAGGQLVYHHARAWFVSTQHGDARLFSLGLGEGDIRPEGTGQGNITLLERVENSLFYVAQYGQNGPELYRLAEDGRGECLSGWNRDFAAHHSPLEPEALPARLPTGLELDGWLLRPAGWQAGRQYPAVLVIHGGPKNVWGPALNHELQFLAARGYAVLFCNPRGSCGRGNTFADIRGRYASVDCDDLLAFLDTALARHGWIDPARVGVYGGSYGGFMVNWLLGHSTRFAAAVSSRGISHWLSMAALSDIGLWFVPDQVTDPWQNPEAAFALSPLKYAAEVQTPTLFLHGADDLRCPAAESLQMYAALKRRGVPCRFCLFKNEGHSVNRSGLPRHRVTWLEETAAWLDAWLGKPTGES